MSVIMRIIPTRMGTRVLRGTQMIALRGSSPRVWGQVVPSKVSIVPSRIIPTRMGTRCSSALQNLDMRDHPHAYGDKRYLLVRHSAGQGSSPCVWGQALRIFIASVFDRIIPTHMGTRLLPKTKADKTEDHPHAYGDKR